MTLSAASKGYYYQDILGAYFVAKEIAEGNDDTIIFFDKKLTPEGVIDKFDDFTIQRGERIIRIQIKFSDNDGRHALSKDDFASKSNYDLALHDLFETWNSENGNVDWRILLSWDPPTSDDSICNVLKSIPSKEGFFPNTKLYQFDCDKIWPENTGILKSWRALRKASATIDRAKFKTFLDQLILEVNCPKSSFLQHPFSEIEELLIDQVEKIGIGVYPNEYLKPKSFVHELCNLAREKRTSEKIRSVSCKEIMLALDVKLEYGGINQDFPVEEKFLVSTQDSVNEITSLIKSQKKVLLTGEPGAGKSWFVENLTRHLRNDFNIVRHYCYTSLQEPLATNRITTNALFGSLIEQILLKRPELAKYKSKRFGSNLDELNRLIENLDENTLIIVDGVDHIWRVYQKNRGGLTEDETTIVEAISQINFSNPKAHLLVLSQPIEELNGLGNIHHYELPAIQESFVEDSLGKHELQNQEFEGKLLSVYIFEKSQGNALYCKYIISQAKILKPIRTLGWLDKLPSYDFNLESYYSYLYNEIKGSTKIPNILCGADFPLTVTELKEITFEGDMVDDHVLILNPILNNTKVNGYKVYHESFKRFVIEDLRKKDVSIEHLVYKPIVDWLKGKDFFTFTKAYDNLLKLYFEVGDFQSISDSIDIDFIEKSLFQAHPISRIKQNHKLQRASLKTIQKFEKMILVSEQAKIIYELPAKQDDFFTSYNEVVNVLFGEEAEARLLFNDNESILRPEILMQLLAERVLNGEQVVHWDIIKKEFNIPYDCIQYYAIKLIHCNQYEHFEDLIKELLEKEKSEKYIRNIDRVLKKYSCLNGDKWQEHVPFYLKTVEQLFRSKEYNLESIIDKIILDDRFSYSDTWEDTLECLIRVSGQSSAEEIAKAIKKLENYNWFRNWLIYLIKISKLSSSQNKTNELEEAFSYLVRDLEPIKGEPRTVDLYGQRHFIHQTFKNGLALCKSDSKILVKCTDLLEHVTELSRGIRGEVSGPLTEDIFLDIALQYCPKEYVLNQFDKQYNALKDYRVYSTLADIAFRYAKALALFGQKENALKIYKQGIQYFAAYGYRKDRTLSEILDALVPFHKAYNTLSPQYFYDVYELSRAVQRHTDRKGIQHYPIEWFQEFSQVFPKKALQYLAASNLQSDQEVWYYEDDLLYFLKNNPLELTALQWFLLAKSQPLVACEEIILQGLEYRPQIPKDLQMVYDNWLASLPFRLKEDNQKFSEEIVTGFKEVFNLDLKLNVKEHYSSSEIAPPPFPKRPSFEKAMEYLEENYHPLKESDIESVCDYLESLEDKDEVKKSLLEIAKSFKYDQDFASWEKDLVKSDSDYWIYFQVCLFVYRTDGWHIGLKYLEHLNKAKDAHYESTLRYLKEIVGYMLSSGEYDYSSYTSCNLIISMCELELDEKEVYKLLNLVKEIVARRIPHGIKYLEPSEIDCLDHFNNDELITALLIARLKTLTTEKTQGIIWSLSYLAKNYPKCLFGAYQWAFEKEENLLPIHRALLLQILNTYIKPSDIPDTFVKLLADNYPTGYFLEDQLIRAIVNYGLPLNAETPPFITLPPSPYDDGFLQMMHRKYHFLEKNFGPLPGIYNTYIHGQDLISKKRESYCDRSLGLCVPITELSNIAYEIANKQFYSELSQMTTFNRGFTCNQEFYLKELLIQEASIGVRPIKIPEQSNHPEFEIVDIASLNCSEKWIPIAYFDKGYTRNDDYKQAPISTSGVVFFGDKNLDSKEPYSHMIFHSSRYYDNPPLPEWEQPVAKLTVLDSMERLQILFLSPYAITKLRLRVHEDPQFGITATNHEGEVVAKHVTWRNNYFGGLMDSTEIPGKSGHALLLRTDYMKKLSEIYSTDGWFVTQKNEAELF